MAKGFKTGGRKVGTKNKLTGTTKEMIVQIVTNELQRLPLTLDQMEPKERFDVIVKLLPYISPKIMPVEEETKVKPAMHLHRLMVKKVTNSTTSET